MPFCCSSDRSLCEGVICWDFIDFENSANRFQLLVTFFENSRFLKGEKVNPNEKNVC